MRRTLASRLAVGSSALVAITSLIGSSRADMVHGTRSTALFERSDVVDLVLDRGHATLIVQRTVENLSPQFEQAVIDIDVPSGGVATALRTLGSVGGKPVWFSGELLEAELAAERYRELTGIGGYYPKDPALLSWRSSQELKLQVFPVAPKTRKTVEYTLEMPTIYQDGRFVLGLGAMGTSELPAVMHARPANEDDALFVDGAPADSKLAVTLDDVAVLGLQPATQPLLGGSLAAVSLGSKRALLHASLELPARISKAPKGAYVVVVLDGSRSLNDDERRAEVAAAQAYVGLLPDAHVEVLTFARKVKARHDGFVGAAAALADLDALAAKFPGENGSALDLALAEAAKLLGTAPAGAPRRVVAMTDFHVRSSVKPEATSVATDTIVHLAEIVPGTPKLERDDDHAWAKVARATGGLVFAGSASAEPADDEVMRDAFEEWVRPRRLDRIVATGVGLDGSELSVPITMHEGEGWEELRIAPFATPALAVTAELWSKKVSALISTTTETERLWSALVFGDDDVRSQLSEPEMMALALHGGAVSPVTSYLAIEPGVRPSTVGLEEGGGGFGSGIGLGMVGGFGHGCGTGTGATFDPLKYLRTELVAALTACGAKGRDARVVLESSYTEVVDVAVEPVVAAGAKKDDALATCVGERLWSLELPREFRGSFHRYGFSTKD